MGIITVHTTQNIDIDYEIGGLGERILARLIDFAVFLPFGIIALIIASANSNPGYILGVYAIAVAALYVFYDLLCEVFFNGQSIGKKVMKIRVISLDGARPKFSQYLLRWLFRMVDFTISGGLVALIAAAVTEKGQRLGDLLAGTSLVKTTPRTTMNNIVFANSDNTYIPVFTQADQLSDKDIALVHEVIQIYYKSGNSVIIYNTAERIKELLQVTTPVEMNSLQFLQTIIKDYSHITSQADIL